MMFGLFGDLNKKEVSKIEPIVGQINQHSSTIEALTKEQIRIRVEELKTKVQDEIKAVVGDESESALIQNEDEREKWQIDRLKKVEQSVLDEILPEAFALVREAAKRTIKERHFDVQLTGGVVLHQGKIAEMRTGEGKTLVATLPAFLNALTGKGVHIVTVNDYLAKRDAAWMGQIFDYLGVTVAAIGHETSLIYDTKAKKQQEKDAQLAAEEQGLVYTSDDSPLAAVSRKAAYQADIVYGTNNEFGFDYLRDNMAQDPEQMVQRELHYAIVDEVDSILIDEARTPLIISAPAEESASEYHRFAKLVTNLEAEKDYTVDEKMKAISLTDAGIAKMESLLGLKNIYEQGVHLVHYMEESLKANILFTRDKDYVVKDGEVVIVDEFTGRMMPGRRYSEGLHQAIEAKEGVEVQKESLTLATISFQNLFRIYQKLSGMTGTAATEAEEFHKIYKLEVVEIPTNRPNQRHDFSDQIYQTVDEKFKAVCKDVAERHQKGQPILIGTISIEKNEYLSQLLTKAGVKHELLNAKNHEKEAHIIAHAGAVGAVTVATNMAGRGTDIKITKEVAEVGGLHVIGTERHESRRIDNQLRGRTGRQGDVGSSQFFVSMDDDLMRIFGGERLKSIMTTLRLPADMPIENKMISRAIESAQKKVEGHNFDTRKHLVEYDDVMNKHREVIYKRRRRILHMNTAEAQNHYIKNQFLSTAEERIRATLNSYLETNQDLTKAKDEIQRIIGVDLAGTEANLDSILSQVKQQYDAREQRFGAEIMRQIEKAIYLRAIDTAWIDHLTAMDHLRDGIGLRGYGQYDPLVAYKQESYKMFQRLLQVIDSAALEMIFRVEVAQAAAQPKPEKVQLKGADESDSGGGFTKEKTLEKTKVQKLMSSEADRSSNKPTGESKKVGRNDPCPCGAKKADGTPVKYKHCHGR
ncbi:MAG: preprotein translocase subunit SecA [Patescibacteria group bacterium]|jgi:preprotein translocase subunit SecA